MLSRPQHNNYVGTVTVLYGWNIADTAKKHYPIQSNNYDKYVQVMKFPIVVFTSCPFPEPEKKAFQGWRCLSNIFSFKNLMLCWMVWLTAPGVSKIRTNALVKVAEILWYIQWARISSFEIWQEPTFWYFLSNFVHNQQTYQIKIKCWWKNHKEIIIKK